MKNLQCMSYNGERQEQGVQTKRPSKPSSHIGNKYKRDNYHTITQNNCEDEHTSEGIYFHTIATEGRKEYSILPDATEAYTKLKIENKIAQIEINVKIDTGAMSNILPLSVFSN